MWSIVAMLPFVQQDFAVSRSMVTVPYIALMTGFAFGSIILGKYADRLGIVMPMLVAAGCIGVGFILSGFAPNIWVYCLTNLLIGIGTGTGFAPLMADISHWFVKRRGLAVVIVACGNYLAGGLWPLLINQTMPSFGWRGTSMLLGLIAIMGMVPFVFSLKRRPSATIMAEANIASEANRADLNISPRLLQGMLILAGLACCMAMAMPQVHIVSYCADLGYGPARGAEMLSMMLLLGVVSRIASGFLADRIGGAWTLLIGSVMQGLALTLYLFFDGLTSLYIISGIFGLFQGGIVPMYAVICRDYLPPKEAGQRIGLVIAATIAGMALGGWMSGVLYDLTGSYRMAFLHGILWNAVNLAVCFWLIIRRMKAKAAMQVA
jgi:MFS family permease